MNLNKISVKQQGGQMIPNEPGMQQQPQVDPVIQQISVFFKESIEQGGKPEQVVMSLMQQEVDQNTIAQALMSLGYQEKDLQVLFQNIQQQEKSADPTAQQVNQNPQQLARQQEIQEGQEGLNVNIDPIEMAKSGIEIKPENEGKFTAWAKARGMGVQEAAKKVMANKDRYPTRIVKMANFAKNAAGWNKAQDGVEIQKLSPDGRNIITEKNGMTILTDNPYDNQDAKSQLQDIEIQIKLLQQQAAIAKAQAQANAKKALLNEQKEGGEFKPHFMYKGDRKIRAKDIETHLRLKEAGYTHDAPKAQTGIEMLKLAEQFANKNNTTISDQNNNVISGQQNNTVKDDGLVSSPLYISPSMFHSGNRWSPAEAVGLVGELFTGIQSAPDTIAADAAANQMDKYSNAAYNVNVDLSEENLNAVDDYLKQYKIENPDATSLPDFSDKVNIKQNDIDSKLNKGVDWLKENLGKLGESAQGIYDSLKTPGFNPKAQTGGEPLSFKEWQMQDSVRRSTANAQQEYQIYVDNFGAQESPSADELYDEINPAELEIDTGGILGGISRLPNTAVAKGFGSVSDWMVRAASNANDYLEDVEDDRKAAKAFRDLSLADNTQPTFTDPLFKRGKGPDINTGLFGSDSDRVTGYYMKNGGTNNPGFKALPKSVQANILQNMQGGGTPGQQIPGMPTKAQLDAITGANKIQFIPRTPQHEYLTSLAEQSVDFQLPNFVEDSPYNEMLVTRLFKESELMKLPSQSENFQLNNFEKMQMGGDPFNPLKLFTGDLEEYQKKGETPRRRTRAQANEEMSALQNQLDIENQRLQDYQSNISKIYKGIQTAENAQANNLSEEEKQKRLNEVLGDSKIKRSIFNYSGDNSYYGPVFGLDTVAKRTRDWVDNEGSGCTTYGCGIMREAGATTADGSPYPYISGNSQLNGFIERFSKGNSLGKMLQSLL